ncbi:NERD domain-containing protein [Bacillus sp. BGMRC 2118]|nr:NERD domain-containing protein [Bacillus sp. BGMRC 2118]
MHLIIKACTKPLKVTALEALLRRIPQNHPKSLQIKEELRRRTAGYRGELAVSYHLSSMPDNDFYIVYDLRLPLDNKIFQIDILLLSSNFALIIEVKNIAGMLFFDRFHKQFIRTKGDIKEGFPDPISQAYRLRSQLHEWIKGKFKITMPIEAVVVLSHPSSVIQTDHTRDSEVKKMVIHAEHLLEYIETMKEMYPNPISTAKTIKRLSKNLVKHHNTPTFSLQTSYQINDSEIITGVQCPHCQAIPMNRLKGRWLCSTCMKTSKEAHVKAIQDSFLLLSPTINNEQFRKFVHIQSKDTAYKLLTSMNLPHNGHTKGRVYFSPSE